nr:helix-turn-helix transcriptional regulator [uncultured Gemmiger sp.]
MDAKTFGAFLADTRRERGMTQAELAELIHVTDKAVSRWERGIGFPDINTLEPLADALGVSLSQLMHAGSTQEPSSEDTLEDFVTMLRPGRILWSGARSALFWLTVVLGIWVQIALPLQVNVHWDNAAGVLTPDQTEITFMLVMKCIISSGVLLQIWRLATGGFFFVQKGAFFRSLLPLLKARHPLPYAATEFAVQLLYCGLMLCPLLAEAVVLLLN